MTDRPDVLVVRLDPSLALPHYAHPGDAGADLSCTEDFVLAPGERRLVGTGLAIALPEGYAGFVHPRSGLAARSGVTIVNTPGTVDAGYRGEVRVCLLNTDPTEPVTFVRGDRIAQLIVQPVSRARFVVVDELPDSARGVGGYGSTGGLWSAPPRAETPPEVADDPPNAPDTQNAPRSSSPMPRSRESQTGRTGPEGDA